MKNILITFVTPWYGYFAGGAEVAARSLAEQLAKRGCDVQVLTTCCRSPFENWWQNTLPSGVEQLNGVTVRRFPVNNQGEDLYHAANYKIIHGIQIDEKYQRQFVNHSINSQALIDFACVNTRGHLVIGLPYIYGLTYSLVKALNGRASIMPCFHDEPQLKWITSAEMMTLSRQILFLTEAEKTLAIQQFGQVVGRRLVESTVIGVGIELPANIKKILDKNDYSYSKDIKLKYQLPEKFFVYVGRKDIGKNILTLINYFQDYQASGGEASLVFLGGGDANLLPKDKEFIDLGFLPEEDKYLIISQAQGLINLSVNESFSLVLMEAWLCEIPVIVHRGCEVTTGHCLNSQGGIPISSSEEFQAALKVLSNEDTNKILARFGKRYVQSKYSWDSVIDRFLRSAYQG
ncbi:glycosyltransferase family 4 protein [Fischerella sp. JS2]|uniref:glycosyltransferase family 4 protein n=1 Tax=Fischerella sp. JS2 TaxID=2597771 RepID=UPI0028E4D83F|nr:glycosyltransferase family 4 protein [Fischerella sp. JS2]